MSQRKPLEFTQKPMPLASFEASRERTWKPSPLRTPTRSHAVHLVMRNGGKIHFVKTDEIDYVEAARDYVRLHCGPSAHVLKERISDIERKLDPTRFLRIHRSTIVGVDRIAEIRPLTFGDYAVILQDGTVLTLSRSHRAQLSQLTQKAG